MAKKSSDLASMESGANFLTDFYRKLKEAVERRGGRFADIHQMVKNGGDKLFDQFAELLVSSKVPVLSRDMRKEGWELVEHTPRRITSVSDLELVSFLKPDGSCINGEEMMRRARQELNANLGQEDAEWLLEHQEQIPAEFRNFYLTFPGTVWRDSNGRRGVPCLGWCGRRWGLGFDWLEGDWGSYGRLLRSRK